ncbi:MAG: hypothetical protein IPL59_00415 [Candidatus Competibacteraceae bacterium]|nr:hypothetical protein [Candidatus Competibacteraceae bacterium]
MKTPPGGSVGSFDFIEFNRLSLADVVTGGSPFAVAIDASFIPTSGQCTYGLDYFYNGLQGRAEKGLEISTLALVDIDDNTAYPLLQSPNTAIDSPKETRVDEYLKHLQQDSFSLSGRHLVMYWPMVITVKPS